MSNDRCAALSLAILIETKVGFADQQIQAFKKLQPLVLAEKGCLQYELNQDVDKPNQFVLIEKWATQADLDAHDITAHMIEADKKSPSFRAKAATVFKLNAI